jgi:hypothetical protein
MYLKRTLSSVTIFHLSSMMDVGRKHLYRDIAMHVVYQDTNSDVSGIDHAWCIEKECIGMIEECKEISQVLKTLSPLCKPFNSFHYYQVNHSREILF